VVPTRAPISLCLPGPCGLVAGRCDSAYALEQLRAGAAGAGRGAWSTRRAMRHLVGADQWGGDPGVNGTLTVFLRGYAGHCPLP